MTTTCPEFGTIEEALSYYNQVMEEEEDFDGFMETIGSENPGVISHHSRNIFEDALLETISDDTPMFSIRHSDVAEHYGKKENEGLKSIAAKYSETNINY